MSERYKIVDTTETELGRFKIIKYMIDVDGLRYPYSYIDVKDSVAVLARKNNKYIFLKQYRKSIDADVLEIPGGAIDEGENPQSAAIRELREETGYVADKIYPLGSFYPTIGVSNEICHLFYAKCGEEKEALLEPLEKIDIIELTADQIDDAIVSNDLMHSMALVAWLKFKKRYKYAY